MVDLWRLFALAMEISNPAPVYCSAGEVAGPNGNMLTSSTFNAVAHVIKQKIASEVFQGTGDQLRLWRPAIMLHQAVLNLMHTGQ